MGWLTSILNKQPGEPTFEHYELSVNYDRCVEEGAVAGGYTRVDTQYLNSRHFPVRKHGIKRTVISLVPYSLIKHYAPTEAGLKRLGYRAIDAHELLALGEIFPRARTNISIVALGSVTLSLNSNTRIYPRIELIETQRNLGMSNLSSSSTLGNLVGAIHMQSPPKV